MLKIISTLASSVFRPYDTYKDVNTRNMISIPNDIGNNIWNLTTAHSMYPGQQKGIDLRSTRIKPRL